MTFGAVMVATVAAMFERIFKDAVDIKSKHDFKCKEKIRPHVSRIPFRATSYSAGKIHCHVSVNNFIWVSINIARRRRLGIR
jgi:hypothetical protein